MRCHETLDVVLELLFSHIKAITGALGAAGRLEFVEVRVCTISDQSFTDTLERQHPPARAVDASANRLGFLERVHVAVEVQLAVHQCLSDIRIGLDGFPHVVSHVDTDVVHIAQQCLFLTRKLVNTRTRQRSETRHRGAREEIPKAQHGSKTANVVSIADQWGFHSQQFAQISLSIFGDVDVHVAIIAHSFQGRQVGSYNDRVAQDHAIRWSAQQPAQLAGQRAIKLARSCSLSRQHLASGLFGGFRVHLQILECRM